MSEVKVATSNRGKAIEIITHLNKAGIRAVHLDIQYPEIRADTFEEVVKAGVAHLRSTGLEEFIIDDSGLRVDALNGFPGVYSAYVYKTIGCQGILRLLTGQPNRGAEFITVIGGFIRGQEVLISGVCKGKIAMTQKGTFGFGYDPIFIPDGETRTFAEMPVEQKNAISHRGRAVSAFIEWYKKQ